MSQKNSSSKLKHQETIEAAVFLAASLGLVVYAIVMHRTEVTVGWEMSPYLFVLLVGAISSAASAAMLVAELRTPSPKAAADHIIKNVLFFIAAGIGYFVLIKLIAFVPATVIFMIASLIFLGEKNKLVIAAVSVGVCAVIYILFAVLLKVMLP